VQTSPYDLYANGKESWKMIQDPQKNSDRHQNLINSFLARAPPFHKISLKSVQNFLRCCAQIHAHRHRIQWIQNLSHWGNHQTGIHYTMVFYTDLLYVLLILWTEVMHSIGNNVSRTDCLTKVVWNALHWYSLIHRFCSYWTCIYLVWKSKP